MKENIYVSTVAFYRSSIEQILEVAEKENLNIEFSSGLAYNERMGEVFLNSNLRRLPHNYFPSPKEPFVLNLASKNENIRRKSIEMCKNGLHFAAEGNCTFYSAHAGYCIDPEPGQLGGKLNVGSNINKKEHWEIFIASINEILLIARKVKVPFLIENNVIITANLIDNENPLFCCDSYEIKKLEKEINDPLFGILLDTAHLKVSSNSLGLNKIAEVENCVSIIKALHHSDNDGLTDSNLRLTNSYWFAEFLPFFKNNINVIEVKNIDVNEIHEQEKLLLNYFEK